MVRIPELTSLILSQGRTRSNPQTEKEIDREDCVFSARSHTGRQRAADVTEKYFGCIKENPDCHETQPYFFSANLSRVDVAKAPCRGLLQQLPLQCFARGTEL